MKTSPRGAPVMASVPPRAHRNDPDTSHEAAEKLSADAVSAQVSAILSILAEQGALAPFEVAAVYLRRRVRMGWPHVKPDSINKRMSELKAAGVVRVARDGEGHPFRATTPFGRRAERLEVAS